MWSDSLATGSSLGQAKLTHWTWLLFHTTQKTPPLKMPLGMRNFVLKWAECRAVTQPLPGPCQTAPSPVRALPGQSCNNVLSSFSLLPSYSISMSLQWEFTPTAKTETSYNPNRRLSLVFSSVLTTAKIQAQKWQHIGKALTLQTRTQIKWCSANTKIYSTPLGCRNIL